MSFPVNIPITFVARVSTVTGEAPEGVTLTLTDPSSGTIQVNVTQDYTSQVGTHTYRGFYVPTITGNWVRTWAGSNLLTTSVATLQVV